MISFNKQNLDYLYPVDLENNTAITQPELPNDHIIEIETKPLDKAFQKIDNQILEGVNDIENSTLMRLGPLKIGKYWGADEEEEDEGSEKKERMPLGTKEHAIFLTALISSFALSGYLGSKTGQSVFGASLAAPSMDIVKKYYHNTKNDQALRYSMTALSLAAFGGSLYLSSLPSENKNQLSIRVASAMPLSYPMFGILKASLGSTLSEVFQSKKMTSTQAKALSAFLQIIFIVGLQIGLIKTNISDPTLGAACGILYKTNARLLTNLGGEEAFKINHYTIRQFTGGTLALLAIAATALGYAGNALNWFDSMQGFMIGYLLIAMTDIFVRTIKQTIRIKIDEVKIDQLNEKKVSLYLDFAESKAPTWQEKTIEGAKKVGYGLINCVVPFGAASVLGAINPDPNQINNSGLIASLTQDATSLCKLPTKLIPVEAVLAATLSAIGSGVGMYTVKEFTNITAPSLANETSHSLAQDQIYATIIALACIGASIGGYHIRRLICPPKIKDIQENNEIEQATREAKAEAKAEKKKAKKAKKAEAAAKAGLLETTPLLNIKEAT